MNFFKPQFPQIKPLPDPFGLLKQQTRPSLHAFYSQQIRPPAPITTPRPFSPNLFENAEAKPKPKPKPIQPAAVPTNSTTTNAALQVPKWLPANLASTWTSLPADWRNRAAALPRQNINQALDAYNRGDMHALQRMLLAWRDNSPTRTPRNNTPSNPNGAQTGIAESLSNNMASKVSPDLKDTWDKLTDDWRNNLSSWKPDFVNRFLTAYKAGDWKGANQVAGEWYEIARAAAQRAAQRKYEYERDEEIKMRTPQTRLSPFYV